MPSGVKIGSPQMDHAVTFLINKNEMYKYIVLEKVWTRQTMEKRKNVVAYFV